MKKQLSKIAKLINGYSFKSINYSPDGIRVIRIANVQDGYISNENPVFYPKDYELKIGDALLEENDLLMSLTGNVGRVGLVNKNLLPAGLNQRVQCIRPFEKDMKNYLYYYFRSSLFKNKVISATTGSSQQNLSIKWLEKHEITVYDIEKRKKIVAELRKIDKIVELKQRQLLKYDKLIKSRFVEMFGNPLINDKGFETKPLAIACPFNKYQGDVEFVNGKVWILTLDKIESNTGFVTEKIYRPLHEIGNSTIKFGTNCVLYSKLRPYLNKVVIPNTTGYATSELICMQTGKEINKQYLASLLMNDSFVEFISNKTIGAKMPRVSMNHLSNFKLMIPSIDMQISFSKFVRQIDKLKFEVQKSLDETQILFDSLLQDYFG